MALGGTADLDGDGDGFRDLDGLPVGARRGDVLFEDGCDEPDKVVTFPAWASVPTLGVPSVVVWSATTGPSGGESWSATEWFSGRDVACTNGDDRSPYDNHAKWVIVAK